MDKKIYLWFAALFLCCFPAQGQHWQCNIYDYQYDMTVYASLQIDGDDIKASDDYELAAFCGDECRGVADVITIPATSDTYYYLRVRSNQESGETITFKVFDKQAGTEEDVKYLRTSLEFESQKSMGLPSNPFAVVFKPFSVIYFVDGEEYNRVVVPDGTVIPEEAEPTKEGHTFSGWSGLPGDRMMPAEDVVVTGSLTPNKYTVTYMIDGEEYSVFTDITYGTSVPQPTTPQKEGYTFSGWDKKISTMPAGDVVISGNYTVNKYSVTYIVDGKEHKVYKDVAYGSAVPQESAPTKTGYTFSGWSEIPATMPDEAVTIRGSFSVNKYSVTYMVDGKEHKVYKDVAYGSAVPQESAPTKTGYTFSGWDKKVTTMPDGNVVISGSFTVNTYKVVYMLDDKEEYKTFSVKYGEAIPEVTDPTKEGYTFMGWSEEIPETMPAEDIVLVAVFDKVNSIGNVVLDANTIVTVYNTNGVLVKKNVTYQEALRGLPKGMYIVNGKKMFVK